MRTAVLTILASGMILGSGFQVRAQDSINQEARNALYASAGNLVLWFTTNVNYERLLTTKDAKIYSSYYLHFGYGGFAAWGVSGRTTDISVQWLMGRKRSHLELGLGIVSFFDKKGYDIGVSNANYPYPHYAPEPPRSDYRFIWPAATIGYRYQKPGGGLVFRTGIASPDGLYLSAGYAF